ncbi:sphingomyelin phosphodiesterase 4 [Epargyreus clarus]|uniref:sphingomyelin phosphodiesterase 4 n=1 Tax=Epargyreus clarus TaxID=520877 RepID=UPI003C2ACA34
MYYFPFQSQFYTCLNLPLTEKLLGLTRIIDQSPPNKELQAIFPQLISNIFASPFNNGWGLRSLIYERNRGETSELINFLEPQGPMFRLCYKLLSDPQLKYNLPLNILPIDLQMTLERGRCPQFYADTLSMDSQSMNVGALALNPFDYYIFHFALDLLNNNQNKKSWESGSSIYAALVCDYLQQFLPLDPNDSVLPLIPHYSGKVPIAAPLQTANWPLCSPSLLLIQDLSGISNQHTTPQTQSRNEVWRTETVVQVFIDLWMSVEQFNATNVNMPVMSTSPERVRLVRIMVKHIHAFSTKYQNDPAVRSSTLRKYARQIMCARGYQYVKHLVTIWPLDASFRIVIEIWLSLIQPWRYTSDTISQDRFPNDQYQEEGNNTPLDATFIQFIAENFPSYTCILQLILPRFMRLDLAAYKNTVMLFRLGKVFSQPHLIPILWNLEQAITDNNAGLHRSLENSYNNSNLDQSYTYNGIALNKWVAIAKQAIAELNMSTSFEYTPVWGENRKSFAIEFVKRIIAAKITAEKNVEEFEKNLNEQHLGIWQSICNFFMMEENKEEKSSIEDFKKGPLFLNNCVHYFSHIFGLNENVLHPLETEVMDVTLENSSFANSSDFAHSITNKLRSNPTGIHYMGDPDLMPIATYENTILVRMLHQIATRLNEVYGETFARLWTSPDFVGYLAREVLQRPITVQRYVKDIGTHQTIVNEDLPPRLSLRRLGSHVFIVWFIIGYIIFKFLSCSGLFYIFCLVIVWSLIILSRASLKRLRLSM